MSNAGLAFGLWRWKQNLKKTPHDLGKRDFEYLPDDPAFPEYRASRPADLVCCLDVLEHIAPDYVSAVLTDFRAITQRFGFLFNR